MVKRLALVLLLVIGFALFVGAQESPYYVRTLYIEQVYPHELGYKIEYRRSNSMFLGASYLPIEWFDGGPASQAKIVYVNDSTVPFINVYWREGEFDHLVLYVHSSYEHLSWGSLSATDDLAAEFDLDEPDFAF